MIEHRLGARLETNIARRAFSHYLPCLECDLHRGEWGAGRTHTFTNVPAEECPNGSDAPPADDISYIGLLGLLPVAIGTKKAWDLRQDAGEIIESEPTNNYAFANRNALAVAAVTAANGGDNISIYTPLFATRAPVEIAVIGLVFAVMTLMWLSVAHWLTNHQTLGIPIRRYGHRVVPLVLIALGVLIMHEAGTIELLRQLS